jgi:hypothetical protein
MKKTINYFTSQDIVKLKKTIGCFFDDGENIFEKKYNHTTSYYDNDNSDKKNIELSLLIEKMDKDSKDIIPLFRNFLTKKVQAILEDIKSKENTIKWNRGRIKLYKDILNESENDVSIMKIIDKILLK